jgi:hypothetical protein
MLIRFNDGHLSVRYLHLYVSEVQNENDLIIKITYWPRTFNFT